MKFKQTIKKSRFHVENKAPLSSFQNVIVELIHSMLANMVKAMLVRAGIDEKFWSNALLYAVYVKNKLPHIYLTDRTSPYEAWMKT